MKENFDIAVIGGGIAGLTAGYEASKAGLKVAVIEKEGFLGGAIMPIKIRDYYIEGYYHHVFVDNYYLFNLSKELGFKIKFYPTLTAFHFLDKFYKLTNAFDLLKFNRLSILERVRLAKLLAITLLIKDIASYDEITAKEWIIKHTGENVYKVFFEPMLQSKFGKNAEKTSAAWLLGRIKMRSARSSKGEMLGYVDGSFKVMIDCLADYIISKNGKIFLNSPIEKIEKQTGGSFNIKTSQQVITSNAVISSIPPAALSKIVDFPSDYKLKLSNLKYQKNICVLMGLNKKLTDFYWINIMNKEISFKAVIEHTNFQDLSMYKEHIIYLANYVDDDSSLWAMEEKNLIELYITDLKKLFTGFDQNDIKWVKVLKTDSAGLIYNKGLLKFIPECTTPISGFFVGGMINCYPKRPINAACLQGVKCAKLAIEYLKQ
ncbi:MAG: NAD(P)/FAD-dependent oxidoreductase [bacterium]|nr:NAD(P)/FAD-dependent oxidoreductase [bacterium]